MPKYCIDTSGLSHPYETIPEDIHPSLWNKVKGFIADGHAAMTKEIFNESSHIDGGLGDFIKAHEELVLYEVNADHWNWKAYIDHNVRMQDEHKQWISEYTTGSPKTICLNDVTIIALAKTLGLPVVSMEIMVKEDPGTKKRRIPNICAAEGVKHLTFNEFCRLEKFKF